MDVSIAEHPFDNASVRERPFLYTGDPNRHLIHSDLRKPFGFICVHARTNNVIFCPRAAQIHGEWRASRYSLQGFSQWYEPEQRNLLIQSLLLESEHTGFQIDLRIAWNQQAIRIWFLSCRLHNELFRCGWVRPLISHQSFEEAFGKVSGSLSSSSSLRKA